jgi:hypothetical protein
MLDVIWPTVLWRDLQLEDPNRVPFLLLAGVDVALDLRLARRADDEDAVELVGLILDGVPAGHAEPTVRPLRGRRSTGPVSAESQTGWARTNSATRETAAFKRRKNEARLM